jgi:hypothetical protein
MQIFTLCRREGESPDKYLIFHLVAVLLRLVSIGKSINKSKIVIIIPCDVSSSFRHARFGETEDFYNFNNI